MVTTSTYCCTVFFFLQLCRLVIMRSKYGCFRLMLLYCSYMYNWLIQCDWFMFISYYCDRLLTQSDTECKLWVLHFAHRWATQPFLWAFGPPRCDSNPIGFNADRASLRHFVYALKLAMHCNLFNRTLSLHSVLRTTKRMYVSQMWILCLWLTLVLENYSKHH